MCYTRCVNIIDVIYMKNTEKMYNYAYDINRMEEIKIGDFDKIEYWIEVADYDLETAKAMLKSKRYLYVGFMCNQAIEKIFKAYYVKTNGKQPPYTHKLIRLAEEGNLYNLMSEEQKDFLDLISPLNIEARYPTQKQELYEALSNDRCKKIIKETEEFILWIKKKLNN